MMQKGLHPDLSMTVWPLLASLDTLIIKPSDRLLLGSPELPSFPMALEAVVPSTPHDARVGGEVFLHAAFCAPPPRVFALPVVESDSEVRW